MIRELSEDELEPALELVWRVFQEYDAPQYGPEGAVSFYRSIHDPAYLSCLDSFGAYEAGSLVGRWLPVWREAILPCCLWIPHTSTGGSDSC